MTELERLMLTQMSITFYPGLLDICQRSFEKVLILSLLIDWRLINRDEYFEIENSILYNRYGLKGYTGRQAVQELKKLGVVEEAVIKRYLKPTICLRLIESRLIELLEEV